MRRSVILDTNLLVLFVVGSAGEQYLDMHKRVQIIDPRSAYALLAQYLERFNELVATPNTLTETSNLIRLIGEPAKTYLTATLQKLVITWPECYITSRDAALQPEFARLGLTDATLLALARRELNSPRSCLLTMDLDLYLAAAATGLNVVNFNHLRWTD